MYKELYVHIIYSDLNLHFGDCTLLIRFLLDTTFHLVSRGSGIVRANGLATLGQKIKLKVIAHCCGPKCYPLPPDSYIKVLTPVSSITQQLRLYVEREPSKR